MELNKSNLSDRFDRIKCNIILDCADSAKGMGKEGLRRTIERSRVASDLLSPEELAILFEEFSLDECSTDEEVTLRPPTPPRERNHRSRNHRTTEWSKLIPKSLNFTGKGDVESYIRKIENIVNSSGLKGDKDFLHFIVDQTTTGSAEKFWSRIKIKEHVDTMERLSSKFYDRFKMEWDEESASFAKFNASTQKEDESNADYMDRLWDLVLSAYPRADMTQMHLYVATRFSMGLWNQEARRFLTRAHPKDPKKALEVLQRYEYSMQDEKKCVKQVTFAEKDDEYEVQILNSRQQNYQGQRPGGLRTVIEDIQKSIKKQSEDMINISRSLGEINKRVGNLEETRGEQDRQREGGVECFVCNERGHIARSCPYARIPPQARSRSPSPSPRQLSSAHPKGLALQ